MIHSSTDGCVTVTVTLQTKSPLSPPPVMSLSDLTGYCQVQNEAISKFISDLSPEEICPQRTCWVGLRAELWGKCLESLKQEEPVERGVNPVTNEDIFLADVVPVTRS